MEALGQLLDDGPPLDDEADHDIRRELAALGRVAHILRTGDFPWRDTREIAVWRAQTARKLEARLPPLPRAELAGEANPLNVEPDRRPTERQDVEGFK
jgi:hypothetical protein